MKRVILFASLTIAALYLSGCNTVEGVGKDIKNAGKAIESGANGAR